MIVINNRLTSENASRSQSDTGEVQRSSDVDRHFADDCDKVWDCGEAIRYCISGICSGPTISSRKQEMLTFLSKAQSAADTSRQIIGP